MPGVRARSCSGPLRRRARIACAVASPTSRPWRSVSDGGSRESAGCRLARCRIRIRTAFVLDALEHGHRARSRQAVIHHGPADAYTACITAPARSERAPIDGVGRRLRYTRWPASSDAVRAARGRRSRRRQPRSRRAYEGWTTRLGDIRHSASLCLNKHRQPARFDDAACGRHMRRARSPLDHALRACPTAPTPTLSDTVITDDRKLTCPRNRGSPNGPTSGAFRPCTPACPQ